MLTDRFGAILDALSDGVIVVDPQGKILFANVEAERLFAYPLGSLVGQSVDVLVPVALATRHSEHRRAYLNAPTVKNMGSRGVATIGRRIDGTEVALEIKLAPISVGAANLVIVSLRESAARPTGHADPTDS